MGVFRLTSYVLYPNKIRMNHTVVERFCKYVQVDTQSDPLSKTFPSTMKQKDLGKILVEELQAMGIKDAAMDEWGYVYATIPSNTDKDVPVICFCSHMDTAPDCSGKDVKPLIHKNYDGVSDIVLPDDNSIVISPKDHPYLKELQGSDIITASGTTLLGADDKAGVAEIMDAAYQIINDPSIKHGDIRILFTPDEEIGRGVDHVDMERLGADFGYTMDSGPLGYIEDETFSADGVTITIHGVSVHPGYAKGKMENAMKIAGEILAALPKDYMCPESTENKEGFVHPVRLSGVLEKAEITFIIRDFTDERLVDLETRLEHIVKQVIANYPNSTYEFKVTEQYRNMKKVLDQHPQVMEYAKEAIRRVGVQPVTKPIRGGTDGSRLSFMGMPCPNIFTGEMAFHSKQEYVGVRDMEKAVEVIVELAKVWEEMA